MKILVAFILLGSLSAFAHEHEHEEHRHHGAHVHGAGTLEIAFDKNIGTVDFKTPAMGILGFEHKSLKAADKAKLKSVTADFEKQFSQMVLMDKALQCRYEKRGIDYVLEAEGHAEFSVTYGIICAKSPAGTEIRFDFSAYSDLKKIAVTVLVDSLQKSLELKNGKGQIDLK